MPESALHLPTSLSLITFQFNSLMISLSDIVYEHVFKDAHAHARHLALKN